MNRLYFSYSLIGLILGFFPVGVVIFFVLGLPDVTWGHSGGEMLHLIALVVLGIPGMTIGCLLGARWQHGRHSAMPVTITMGALVGAVWGFIAGMILLGELLQPLLGVGSFQEGTVGGCLGIFLGGILGILLGGLSGRKRNSKSALLVTIPLGGLVGSVSGLIAGANYLGDLLQPVLGELAAMVGAGIGILAGGGLGILLGFLIGSGWGKTKTGGTR